MASYFSVDGGALAQSNTTRGTVSNNRVLQFHLRQVTEEQYAIALGVAGVDRVTLLEGGDSSGMVVQVSDGFDPRAVRAALVGQLRTTLGDCRSMIDG